MQRKPPIVAIVAMAENRVIGKDNKMPWHLPADLSHFRQLTTNHAVLMGRKTHESIGKPLPNRVNLIMSRDPSYKADGCTTVQSIEEAFEYIINSQQSLFIIGGAEIYKLLMPHIEQLYLTIIHQQIEGDTRFPALHESEWQEIDRIRHEADDKNAYAYSFVTMNRIRR